jgi:hypothetical protein
VRDKNFSNLPAGYSLDLVDNPDVIALLREDGSIVARFTHASNLQQIRRAAEEDLREQEEE